MRCPACGNEQSVYGVVDGYKIYICATCGLGETEDKTLPNYKDYHRDTTYFQEGDQFKNIFTKRLQIVSSLASPGKVLEVGSSVGTLLALFKDAGWEVLGIEPSTYAAREAAKRGIPTRQETFENTRLTEGTFDAVIFNHVLEHVRNPTDVLKKTSQVLKKGGIILVDVPNFGSLRSNLQGTAWGYLYPNEHKWHFSKDSLLRLLKKSGFQAVYSETRSGIWDYGNPLLELWQSFTGLKLRFFKNILFLVPNYFISVLGVGSGLTVIGRKK